MGILEEVLAKVDALRRTTGRNVQDMVQQPSLYVEKMTDALRNTNRGVAPVASNGELTNRELTPSERVEQSMGTLDFGGGLGVIKPKGGNWLSGRYGPESAVGQLKRNVENIRVPAGPDGEARTQAAQVSAQAVNDWIDQKLIKYVKNDMASPTDPIRKLADTWPEEKASRLAEAEARVQALRQKQEAQAATRGVPEEYLTRTRQDVLKAEEARDLIAENRGLHYEPAYNSGMGSTAVRNRRIHGGFSPDPIATTELGQAWENTADSVIGRNTVKDFQLPDNITQDPWLAKADPNAPVYNLKDAGYEPGFAHLTDELRNSLREGRLTPAQLSKMPIDQAVRHVAEVNALRSVKARQAQAMDMQSMPIHKDYPDQGYSWRQLQHEDEPTLQKWLTQEGDAMGHCVGGYCPDVQSGASNIYSLRDAKGQPHVTIETAPSTMQVDTRLAQAIQRAQNEGVMPGMPNYYTLVDAYEAEAALPQNIGMAIKQIKGKANKAPKAEYLPFIQDFVRSGKWSEIGDAANTGLSSEEIDQILKGTK